MKHIRQIIALLLVTIFLYLPILIAPNLFLDRANDLAEFSWPMIYFVKQQIFTNHSFPFWNNLILSGMPLLPDPHAPFFYLPNIIFFLLPIGIGFIVSSFLHTFVGGIGTYLAAHYSLRLSKKSSLLAGILYILIPKMAGYLEAGHYGLIASSAWLPYVFLTTIKLLKKPGLLWSTLLALSLAGLFFTHTVTFVSATLITSIILLVSITFSKAKKLRFKSVVFLGISGVITFGLIALSLLPQLEWAPQTSRVFLKADKQVYPIWLSFKELLQSIFIPWINGKEYLQNLDSEKWMALGILSPTLATIGFFKLKKQNKIEILLLSFFVSILVLNNLSPFYEFLLGQSWYVLGRVSTRIWYVAVLATCFLAAYGLEKLKIQNTKFKIGITLMIITELILISWLKITKPIPDQSKFAPKEVYQFLAQDNDKFRVFCVNRCLSQRESAKFNLELVEGYNTLAQINYFKHAWQLTGTYWNYYTLAIPPIGAYKFEGLHPDAISLGEYNTKYVISPHQLIDSNFELVKEFGSYKVYLNKALKPRANVPILFYSPNHIRLDTKNFSEQQIILSEVYNSGWKAYLNGKEKVPVSETPIALREVDIKPNTQFVDFKYEPDSFKLGKLITLITIGFLITLVIIRHKNLYNQSPFFQAVKSFFNNFSSSIMSDK